MLSGMSRRIASFDRPGTRMAMGMCMHARVEVRGG
jgi:hypothetical protein